jgi:hypothetical protein
MLGCQDHQYLYQGRRKLQNLKFQEGKVALISCRRIPQAFHQLETRHFSVRGCQTNDEINGRCLSQNQNQEALRYHQRFQVTWPGQKGLFAIQKARI